MERRGRVGEIYEILYAEYGPQGWWPAKTPFEVCVGAILTQSTSWTNVEKAVGNLKNAKIMSQEGIRTTRTDRLARLIRPSLYHNVKARKLKEFVRFLNEAYGGKVNAMRSESVAELRERLLGVWGIGPETADSILLYALDKPSFVVDAYTRRVFSRLGLVSEEVGYDGLKRFFEERLPEDAERYNEYHALVVTHAKGVCKTKPFCQRCCLNHICKYKAHHT